MAEAEAKSASPTPAQPSNTPGIAITSRTPALQTPIVQVASRMLRSPSHESVTTDVSLFSVLSIASDTRSNRLVAFKSYSDAHLSTRGPSPNPESRHTQGNRPADIPEVLWFEEETELIRSCGALSAALGLQKSFSTGDVSQLPSPETSFPRKLRSAVSTLALDIARRNGLLIEQARLDHASRSCSMWVAVGDVGTTSQLPSPHGGAVQQPPISSSHPSPIPFTAADLVRSVNKKVRQSYIRRRLMTTYRALERLSQSEFNLDRLEAAASAAAQSNPGATLSVPGLSPASGSSLTTPNRKGTDHPLTVRDVERERGKELLKYERNMMIFNWLHTLDDTAMETLE